MAYSARAFLPRRRKVTAYRPGALTQRSKPGHPIEYSTQVSRFTVEAFTGESHPCVLPGEPTGGKLKDGDFVHVTARRTRSFSRSRSGERTARLVVVLSNANGVPVARITPAKRTEFATARRMNQVSLALVLPLLAGFAAALLLFF